MNLAGWSRAACGATLALGSCAPSTEVGRPPVVDEPEVEIPVVNTTIVEPRGTIWPSPSATRGLIPEATRRLNSGLWIVAPENTGRLLSPATAQLALTIPVGVLDGKPGVAELLAEAVVENPAGTETHHSLRWSISTRGGTVALHVGAHSTTFAIEIPDDAWKPALIALTQAVSTVPSSRAQLDRIRQEAMSRRSTQLQRDPLDATVEHLLAGGEDGPSVHLTTLGDRDITEVSAFHRLEYSPMGVVLGVLVPGLSGEDALRDAAEIIASWQGSPAPERHPEDHTMQTGIYWSAGDDPSRLAIIVAHPEPWEPQAAGVRLLQECTTMSGFGGRLARALSQMGASGFVFTDRVVVREGRRHLILEATIDPAIVPTLWRVLRDVQGSFTDQPPSGSERQLAAGRVQLIELADQANPRLWLDRAMWRILRQQAPEPPTVFLDQINDPETLDLRVAAALLQNHAMVMVVVGGRPDQSEDMPYVELPARQRTEVRIETADLEAQIAAAEPYLQRAVEAAGGLSTLRSASGYSAVSVTTPETGPILRDQVWVAADRMRRVRQVLSTTIETIVTPEESFEVSGGERRQLSDQERRMVLREAHSHPIALLAAYSRGELRFRLASVRPILGRRIAILEAVDSPFERLRAHIDSGSGLVRQIETWQGSPATGPVYVREIYSDYRSTAGIRAPFHRLTDLDDGSHRQETAWQEFVPRRPADSLLRSSSGRQQ